MFWTKLSTKKILDHPRFVVHEDIVELPSGEQTEYVRIDRQDAATIIAINEEGKILLQKEYSYPPNEHLYQFPGGSIEKNETPEEGAIRELSEEAGLTGNLQQIGWFYPDNRRSANKFYVFVATELQPSNGGVKDAEEEFEDFWYTQHEISELIRSNEIRNYSALAAWSLFINR